MNSMGLPVHAYLVSMYGFFAAMYTVVCTVFWASGAAPSRIPLLSASLRHYQVCA